MDKKQAENLLTTVKETIPSYLPELYQLASQDWVVNLHTLGTFFVWNEADWLEVSPPLIAGHAMQCVKELEVSNE